MPAISDEYCNYKEVLTKLEPFEEHFDVQIFSVHSLKNELQSLFFSLFFNHYFSRDDSIKPGNSSAGSPMVVKEKE